MIFSSSPCSPIKRSRYYPPYNAVRQTASSSCLIPSSRKCWNKLSVANGVLSECRSCKRCYPTTVGLRRRSARRAKKTIMNQQRWVDVFNTAGLPAALEPDMPLWLRNHAPMCVAFESISCAGQRRHGGASWKEALTIARGVHTSYRLIKALGYTVYPRGKQRIAGSPVWVVAALLWVMSRVRSFRELLATGQAECSALLDTMLAAGLSHRSMIDLRRIEAMRPVQKP